MSAFWKGFTGGFVAGGLTFAMWKDLFNLFFTTESGEALGSFPHGKKQTSQIKVNSDHVDLIIFGTAGTGNEGTIGAIRELNDDSPAPTDVDQNQFAPHIFRLIQTDEVKDYGKEKKIGYLMAKRKLEEERISEIRSQLPDRLKGANISVLLQESVKEIDKQTKKE